MKIIAHRPTHISAVATVLLITERERAGGGGGGGGREIRGPETSRGHYVAVNHQ